MKLSKNFTLAELTFSETAKRNNIDNTASKEIQKNLKTLCNIVLQPLRDKLEVPITILSGYRNPTVNKKVGGSKNSQHMKGLAADIRVSNMSVKELIGIIKEMGLPYDQLINEFDSWVHVSIANKGKAPRKSAFSIK